MPFVPTVKEIMIKYFDTIYTADITDYFLAYFTHRFTILSSTYVTGPAKTYPFASFNVLKEIFFYPSSEWYPSSPIPGCLSDAGN